MFIEGSSQQPDFANRFLAESRPQTFRGGQFYYHSRGSWFISVIAVK